MTRIGVIDYGSGNFRSVWNALTHVGADLVRATTPKCLASVDRVVLPGVGSFAGCMARLGAMGLDDALRGAATDQTPLLGICVGMQVLADVGFEHGEHHGLGLVPGEVRRVDPGGSGARIPQVGWNQCEIVAHGLAPFVVGDAPEFYFVHSYHLVPDDPAAVVAVCDHGERVTAAVRRGSVTGVQFHPEKSQRDGLAILSEFAGMVADHAA